MDTTVEDFPFVADLPKREQKQVRSVVSEWNDFKEIVRSKGQMVPPNIAAAIANVSRQRIHQLIQKGTLEAVNLHGSVFITEASFTAWVCGDRTSGRPCNDPSGPIVKVIRSAAKK